MFTGFSKKAHIEVDRGLGIRLHNQTWVRGVRGTDGVVANLRWVVVPSSPQAPSIAHPFFPYARETRISVTSVIEGNNMENERRRIRRLRYEICGAANARVVSPETFGYPSSDPGNQSQHPDGMWDCYL